MDDTPLGKALPWFLASLLFFVSAMYVHNYTSSKEAAGYCKSKKYNTWMKLPLSFGWDDAGWYCVDRAEGRYIKVSEGVEVYFTGKK